jgi:oligo-1,6-glucosidase
MVALTFRSLGLSKGVPFGFRNSSLLRSIPVCHRVAVRAAMKTAWWHNAVAYQIYPRSFCDSNGDGIGDIPGIISKLDYLATLGVDVLWLCPVYRSPNDDNGYDISDYCEIMDEFGTMDDMDCLIAEARKRGMRIVMDLVVNHTSDEHPWFLESRKSKDNPYRDYYIWRDPEASGGPPSEMQSIFSGSAWEFDAGTGQYYFHLFSRKQPDLNWANAELRAAIFKIMRFWLEKGIGGFRMDVIDLIGKEIDRGIIANGPRLHEYLQEMHRETLAHFDVMTVGEAWGSTPETAKLFSDPARRELSMIFQFEHICLDEEPGKGKWALRRLRLADLKRVLSRWQTELGDEGWNSLFWNNHDTPRIVSRWGDDGAYRVRSAKMLATLLHLMKGTPYIYQGEEIGMTNVRFEDVSEFRDIEMINWYREQATRGASHDAMMTSIHAKGRDNARTPMQWDASPNAGFTTGRPWLKVNPNHAEINVARELEDRDSVFHHYRSLVRLRKEHDVIVHGGFRLILEDHPAVFAYTRSLGTDTLLVICNFYEEPARIELPSDLKLATARLVICNYAGGPTLSGAVTLRAYEAVVYQLAPNTGAHER